MTAGTLDQKRSAAKTRFETLGYPTRKSESWKYVDLEPITKTFFKEPVRTAEPQIEACALAPYLFAEREEIRLVFLNGFYSKKWSSLQELPRGVVIKDLGTQSPGNEAGLLAKYLATEAGAETNAFAALNTLHFNDGAFCFVPDGVVLQKPVHFLFITTQDPDKEPMVYYPRVVMALGANAQAHAVMTHATLSGKPYFVDAVIEAYLAEGARLDFAWLQHGGSDSGYFLSSEKYKLQKDTALQIHHFTEGGLLTRSEIEVEFAGEGSTAELNGLSVLEGRSRSHDHLTVRHTKGHGTSRQFYKNILSGTSVAEFDSLVHVAPGAAKSDSRQLNRNLILSPGAVGHSRPRLEIHTDDVSCAHGATTGPMEESELFYLRSRGLSLGVAKELLVYGFAEEILATIQEASIRERLESFVRSKLTQILGQEREKC